MHPAPRTRAGRSVFSMFAVQAALTALFGLFNSGMVHGHAARNIAIAAALLCLAVAGRPCAALLAIVGDLDARAWLRGRLHRGRHRRVCRLARLHGRDPRRHRQRRTAASGPGIVRGAAGSRSRLRAALLSAGIRSVRPGTGIRNDAAGPATAPRAAAVSWRAVPAAGRPLRAATAVLEIMRRFAAHPWGTKLGPCGSALTARAGGRIGRRGLRGGQA